jgi:hypothetical protein
VAIAEQGVVLLDGPLGVVLTLTPEAAIATSENLRHTACLAARQRGEAAPSHPVCLHPKKPHP